jgi:hypothetical protein
MARKRIEHVNDISGLLLECFFPIMYVKSIYNNPYSYARISYDGVIWEQREELKDVSMSFEIDSDISSTIVWTIRDFFEDFYE